MRIGQVQQSIEIPQVKQISGVEAEFPYIGTHSSGIEAEFPYIGTHRSEQAENESFTFSEADFGKDMLDKSLNQANKTLSAFDRQISREVHDKTGAVMYKIVDIKTRNVIAEFPPKKIQDMIAKMWELAGLFVDEKA